MKIAIIDTGIDCTHKRLKDCDISGISIKKDNENVETTANFFDTIGHGTACASIIHKSIPEASLCAIKIYHANLTTCEDTLIEALHWIKTQNDIRIINISLGTTGEPNIGLTKVSRELYEMGKIIVASCDNNINLKAYPASYPWVFGVMSGQVKKSTDIGCFSEEEAYFMAKGSIQRVAWNEGKDLIVTGTSYATPHLTGLIANIITESPDYTFDDIKQELSRRSNKNIKPLQFIEKTSHYKVPLIRSKYIEEYALDLFNPQKRLNWINRIGIFPISEKEMKQFIDFSYLVQFSVSTIFDYPRTFSSFGINNDKCYKRTLPSEDELKNFDTLVVGYYYDNLWEGNIIFGNQMVDLAIKNNKNFFVYDHRLYDYLCQQLKAGPHHVYMPQIEKSAYEKTNAFQLLPNVSCPVVMVIGTGNKQGKFTTQLRLKEVLEEEGYSTGFVSTEPQGELFGANFVYPYGYMSTVKLAPIERLLLLRNIFKGICEFVKPHIILTGSQGALISETPLTPVPYLGAMDSVGMMYGSLPDIVVCTISPDDSITHIKQTVFLAQLYSKCKVAFYVMTPWNKPQRGKPTEDTYLPEELFNEKADYFQKELKTPVINIMDNRNNKLIIKSIERICT